ncbi:DedA family protein [Actinoplanes palleronii]|uniref:Membrane protein n=1 Tax=Actinoplanes palleronii TaxID=113570 RepID=A0ABQ4B077_9ACTN|nr:VTT domain-containing protein [Actinoplanes palleronii]GIE64063.1 membrane protein [Actinoplanes palleronii]
MSQYVELLTSGRWVLVVVLAAAMVDVVLPFIPSETIIVAVGVGVAEAGHPLLIWVMVAAAAGVVCGDGLAYLVGRRSGAAVRHRLRRGRRGAVIHDWVLAVMRRHGGALIIFGRFVPGVRSAAAFTAGAVGYPGRRFVAFTGVGAVVWAAQSALLGYLGGVAFADRPLAGFGVAWLGAGLVTVLAMVGQRHAGALGRRLGGVVRRLIGGSAGVAGRAGSVGRGVAEVGAQKVP